MVDYKEEMSVSQKFIFEKLEANIGKMVSHQELLMYVDEGQIALQKKALAVQMSKLRKIIKGEYMVFPIFKHGYMLLKQAN